MYMWVCMKYKNKKYFKKAKGWQRSKGGLETTSVYQYMHTEGKYIVNGIREWVDNRPGLPYEPVQVQTPGTDVVQAPRTSRAYKQGVRICVQIELPGPNRSRSTA